MNCPKCQTGRIRIWTIALCSCGHYLFFCDGCFTNFGVPCGPPYDATALPPEFPLIDANEGFAEDDCKELTEMLRGIFAKAPDSQAHSLLEDFKSRK